MILQHANIRRFREVFEVSAEFHNGISYVIGRNGTGKTTFVRLLVAALTAEVKYLLHAPFDLIELTLRKPDGAQWVLTYARQSNQSAGSEQSRGFSVSLSGATPDTLHSESAVLEPSGRDTGADELISQINMWASLSRTSNRRLYVGGDRGKLDVKKIVADGRTIQKVLSEGLRVRWLPIERTLKSQASDDLKQAAAPSTSINRKVQEVQNQLVRYFAELEKEKSAQLELFRNNSLLALFDVEVPQRGAISRTRVDAIESEINELIPELHLDETLETKFRTNSQHLVEWLRTRKGRPIEVRRQSLARLEQVLSYWSDTQGEIRGIFAKRDAFIEALESAFAMSDLTIAQRTAFAKKPELRSNNEIGFKRDGISGEQSVGLLDLSSGEKQFLILLSEALLERDAETILIIDEPELSLHITWQRRLVHDLRRLNPNVQLILATHSPDVVSTSEHALLQMENIVVV